MNARATARAAAREIERSRRTERGDKSEREEMRTRRPRRRLAGAQATEEDPGKRGGIEEHINAKAALMRELAEQTGTNAVEPLSAELSPAPKSPPSAVVPVIENATATT